MAVCIAKGTFLGTKGKRRVQFGRGRCVSLRWEPFPRRVDCAVAEFGPSANTTASPLGECFTDSSFSHSVRSTRTGVVEALDNPPKICYREERLIWEM